VADGDMPPIILLVEFTKPAILFLTQYHNQ